MRVDFSDSITAVYHFDTRLSRRASLHFLYFSPFGARVGGEEWIRKNVPFYLWIYSIIGQRFFS